MVSVKIIVVVLALCLLATCLEAKKDSKKSKGPKKNERVKQEKAKPENPEPSPSELKPDEDINAEEKLASNPDEDNEKIDAPSASEQAKEPSEADNQEVKVEHDQEQAGEDAKKPEEAQKEDDTAKPEESNEEGSPSDSPPAKEHSPEASEDGPQPAGDKAEEESEEDKDDNEEEIKLEGEDAQPASAFKCNLKFSRVGCFNDKAGVKRPLASLIMSDEKLESAHKKSGKSSEAKNFDKELPSFACKCANAAMKQGNAIFGIQNLAECWSGADDSKYDKDGPSESCVTYGYKPCLKSSEMCAGNKNANFVYYVDADTHTKSKIEIDQEMAKIKKAQKILEKAEKVAAAKKLKKDKKKKASKKGDVKSSKKHGKHH